MKILVTGGAGFIGSAVIRHIISNTSDSVVNVDKLTYAGNLESLLSVNDSSRYFFEKADICDRHTLDGVLQRHEPDAIMHLAAESHVDRSIDGPAAFMETNIIGTYTLLEAARQYWNALDETAQQAFRFHHISTDEVYGDLDGPEDLFTETTPLCTQLPVFRQQGQLRPSGARLVADLWLSHTDHQLLKQLRALPLPGKAHPTDDPQCPGRKTFTGVRPGYPGT